MNIFDKIKFLQKAEDDPVYYNKYFVDISVKKNRWQPREIDELRQQYPWLSQFYLDFIAEFDALGLSWVVFYGSRHCDVIPIWEEIDYWKDQAKDQYLPFGKHPSGGIYTFNKNNEVIYFSKDDYDWESPQLKANNLEDFIDNCLLGKRYIEFNQIAGESLEETDSFYQLLKDQGWV